MKKTTIILVAVIAVIVLIGLWIGRGYNKMVTAEEQVSKDWAQVENQYQRRADLIPNLVATVKGYAEHEQSTLDAVVSARAEAINTKIDANNLTEEQLAEFQAKQGELGMALGRLLAITENYPDLKASENFRNLSKELTQVENAIANSRKYYNAVVRMYNNKVEMFPSNIIAKLFSYHTKKMFEIKEEEKENVEVEL